MSDSNTPQLGFIHRFIYPTNSDDPEGNTGWTKSEGKNIFNYFSFTPRYWGK